MIEIYTGTILSQPTVGLLDDGTRVTYALFQKDHTDMDRKYGKPCEPPRKLSVFHSFTTPETTEVIDRCIAGDRLYLEGGRVGRRKFSASLVRLIPPHLDAMAISIATQAELDAFCHAGAILPLAKDGPARGGGLTSS